MGLKYTGSPELNCTSRTKRVTELRNAAVYTPFRQTCKAKKHDAISPKSKSPHVFPSNEERVTEGLDIVLDGCLRWEDHYRRKAYSFRISNAQRTNGANGGCKL